VWVCACVCMCVCVCVSMFYIQIEVLYLRQHTYTHTHIHTHTHTHIIKQTKNVYVVIKVRYRAGTPSLCTSWESWCWSMLESSFSITVLFFSSAVSSSSICVANPARNASTRNTHFHPYLCSLTPRENTSRSAFGRDLTEREAESIKWDASAPYCLHFFASPKCTDRQRYHCMHMRERGWQKDHFRICAKRINCYYYYYYYYYYLKENIIIKLRVCVWVVLIEN